MQTEKKLQIDEKFIGQDEPTYFIADIAANHDGDLQRAIDLIYLAADAGADAAKFQHFKAESIVSDLGFTSLGTAQSHQSKWKQSVFEVYKSASIDLSWTPILADTCKKAGITFFTSPYSIEIVDEVDPYVPAYKIGSGDITWLEIIRYIASKNKPYIIATGASTMDEVLRAVNAGLAINPCIALLQCNTNYTAKLENFKYIQLNVLKCYREMFPQMVLGLSDHTPGHATVLGSVALGARLIEKHFTDDTTRRGPDHAFSMDPLNWREMVDRTRELELSLGTGVKKVESNELETVVIQRRSIRAMCDISQGTILSTQHMTMLRPCPADAVPPYKAPELCGKVVIHPIKAGDCIRWTDLK